VRALSFRQAASCEAALSTRCRCRCGGAFHGTLREVGDLRQGDPHALRGAAPPVEEGGEATLQTPERSLSDASHRPPDQIEMSEEEAEQLRWETISRASMEEAAAAVGAK
jgi:hypothetical protein